MPPSLPERLQLALQLLRVQPDDRILEVGCAGGALLSEIARLLHSGCVTGLDRSASSEAKVRSRFEGDPTGSRVTFFHGSFEQADLPAEFNKIVAVNVNAFWLSPEPMLTTVRRILLPRGGLYLVYGQPSVSQLRKAERLSAEALQAAGFISVDVHRPSTVGNLCAIVALQPDT